MITTTCHHGEGGCGGPDSTGKHYELAGKLKNNRWIPTKIKTSRINLNLRYIHLHTLAKGLIKGLTPTATMAAVAGGSGGRRSMPQSPENMYNKHNHREQGCSNKSATIRFLTVLYIEDDNKNKEAYQGQEDSRRRTVSAVAFSGSEHDGEEGVMSAGLVHARDQGRRWRG